MAGRFAGCQRAVVASTAATEYCGVIHVGDRTPGRCRVACRTRFRRCNMAGWFHCRENRTDLGMAACARGACTLENATCVASVAVDILVRAIEIEAGTEVVKLLLCIRGRCEQQYAEHYGDKRFHWIR